MQGLALRGGCTGAASVGLLLYLLGTPLPLAADDGAIEINQAAVQASGGFPYLITGPGSYRLTGSLDVSGEPGAVDQSAIVIDADNVWLDLGGFSLIGPLTCTGAPPASSGLGGGVVSSGVNTVVVDGSIVGFGGIGVSLGPGSRVERVTVSCSGDIGIAVGAQGVVERSSVRESGAGIATGPEGIARDNRAADNLGFGLIAGARTGFGGNMLTGNNGGDPALQVFAAQGAFELAPNVCQSGIACTAGPQCGNGIAEGSEACDGSDLLGETCEGLGFGGGTLACDASCAFDTSACIPLCPVGYVNMSSTCVWGGAPADAGFETGTPWTAQNAAVIDPGAAGSIEPGEARFNRPAICALDRVQQSFEMPARAEADPFVVRIRYEQRDASASEAVPLAVGVNGAFTELSPRFAWDDASFCLGERGYGGNVDLDLSSVEEPELGCASTPSLDLAVDRIAIEVDTLGECPAPGGLINADFEGSVGWDFSASGINAVANYAAGVGQGGTRAGRLFTERLCSTGRASAKLSVPLAASLPNPAVEFWWTAGSGVTSTVALEYQVDGRAAASTELVGDGAAHVTRLCLPDGVEGLVPQIDFSLAFMAGACPTVSPRELLVDDVALVSDASCGSSEPFDGGFELAAAAAMTRGWLLDGSTFGGQVSVVNDAASARTGSGSLRAEIAGPCDDALARLPLTIPSGSPTAGPAIELWHRAPTALTGTIQYRLDRDGLPSGVLASGVNWTRTLICVDRRWSGRMTSLDLRLDGPGGLCASPLAESVHFDDVLATKDPSCP